MKKHKYTWLPIVIGMLVVNIGGAGMAILGVALPALAEAFQAPFSQIALGSSITMVIMGVMAPFVGRAMDKYSVKLLFTIGAVILVLGFLVDSWAPGVVYFLIGFAMLGFAAALLSPMVVIKYLSHYFMDRMGFATGLATLPVSIVLFPPLAKVLLDVWGWQGMFLGFGVLAMGLLVLVQIVKEPVATAADTRDSDDAPDAEANTAQATTWDIYSQLLKAPAFWIIVLSMAILVSGSSTLMTHLMVIGPEKGLTGNQSVSLLSLFGMATIAGSPSLGWVADRFGAHFGFMIGGACYAAGLAFFFGSPSYTMLVLMMLVFGFFSGGAYVCFAGLLQKFLGKEFFGTGIGLATLLMLPITAAAPPLAGLVRDSFGSYNLYFTVQICLLLLVSVTLALKGKSQPFSLAAKEADTPAS